MIDSYILKAFSETDETADFYFNRIDELWPPKPNEELVSLSMKKKIFHDEKVTVFPYILYLENKPVGITWVELSTEFYGNINAFIPEEKHFYVLAKLLNDKDYFTNKMMEIVTLQPHQQFADACFQQELVSNIRQRMYLWLTDYNSYSDGEHPFTFEPYTGDDYDWGSKLSVQAHAVSKDYVHYEEMKNPSNRLRLENRVLNGIYGNILQSASLKILFNNKPVGYCLVVNVACWGYKEVPWIFDISIDPAFHGQGLGKALIHQVVQQINKENYEIMGLAVTLTNRNAIQLYQKIGFQRLDVFYEFIKPL